MKRALDAESRVTELEERVVTLTWERDETVKQEAARTMALRVVNSLVSELEAKLAEAENKRDDYAKLWADEINSCHKAEKSLAAAHAFYRGAMDDMRERAERAEADALKWYRAFSDKVAAELECKHGVIGHCPECQARPAQDVRREHKPITPLVGCTCDWTIDPPNHRDPNCPVCAQPSQGGKDE